MTKIYTIPGISYDDRVQLIKNFRAELGLLATHGLFVPIVIV
jgi:hypothetical protein